MKILCVSTRKIETAEGIKNCFPICEIMSSMTQEQKDGKIQEWLDTGGKKHFSFPCPIYTADIEIEGGWENLKKVFTKTA